jgi:hypothetical protein
MMNGEEKYIKIDQSGLQSLSDTYGSNKRRLELEWERNPYFIKWSPLGNKIAFL